jgi:Phasin protein
MKGDSEMSEQPKTEQSYPMTSPFGAPIFAEAWQMPMKVLLEEQAELLDESRKMSAAWMKRRQEATEAGLQAFGALAGCRDPGTVAAICSEWFKGSMDRLMADMNDARAEGARLAEIGQRSALALFRQGVDTVAADKLVPSAPNREPERAKRPSRSESGRETGERSAAE